MWQRDVPEGRTFEALHQYQMHELTAKHVLGYGIDDVITAQALFNHFRTQMALENTQAAFALEQKPMYLSALSYVEGIPISLERLQTLRKADDITYERHSKTLDAFLIEQGWDGTVCPEYTELTPAGVKEIFTILTGGELKTQVRTIEKLAKLVAAEDHPDAELLGNLIGANKLAELNKWVASRFKGTPRFEESSPKQMAHLLYTVLGLPIRLRNKATDVMRAKGVYEGTPKTDDDAVLMAIRRGDATGRNAEVLTALMEMKSINTKRGLYYEPYPKAVHWKTQRLHPELRQSSTNTRRWTSANINIQQLDKSYGAIRSVILPHKKNAIVASLDESAQEVRIMADQSRDPNLLSCYLGTKEQRRDIHSFVSAMVSGVTYEEFVRLRKAGTPEEATEAEKVRDTAKIVFFAQAYGAMAKKIAEGLGVDEEVAQSYLDSIYAAFPGARTWKEGVENQTGQLGYVRTHRGAMRHLRKALLSENKWESSKALRQAVNTVIQSSGAEQMKEIMGRVWDSDLIETYDFRWYFPCHDECVVSIGREDTVPVLETLHGFMTAQFLTVVPSASSIGFGPSFGELTELGEVFDAALIEKTLGEIFKDKVAA
jgi:hypothetical protein